MWQTAEHIIINAHYRNKVILRTEDFHALRYALRRLIIELKLAFSSHKHILCRCFRHIIVIEIHPCAV